MKSDPRDYQLDISSLAKPAASRTTSATSSSAPPSAASNPYLSVLFNCCRVYQRVYRDPSGDHYAGRCPRCLRTIRFEVGPGGTAGRSFVVE